MPAGYITGYIDTAQLALYAFWVFFIGLIFYLRREDRREGYPLLQEQPESFAAAFAGVPKPKTFLLPHGGSVQAPRHEAPERELAAVDADPWFGSPLVPTGNPMIDGIGPAAWANRNDTPELTYEGEHRMAPLRVAIDFFVEGSEADPRGMTVFGLDRRAAGTVSELWVDRTEPAIRYFEVKLLEGGRTVMLPLVFVNTIGGTDGKTVAVSAITAAQFADVPGLGNLDQITALEEDKVAAYYAGGFLYATPQRSEPLI